MLRLINIQEINAIQYDLLNEPQSVGSIITADVVDVTKQETIGQLIFTKELGQKLLESKGEERTKLTTITGYAEQHLRKYFKGCSQ